MKIYIFRPGQLGDSLTMVPSIILIRKLYPDTKFVLLTNKPAKSYFITSWEVFKNFDFFEKVIPYSKNFYDLIKIFIELRKNSNSILYLLAVKTKWGKLRDTIFFKYICGVKQIVGIKESHTNLIRRKSNGFLVKSLRDSEKFIRIIERFHNVKLQRPEGCLLPINEQVVSKVNQLLESVQIELKKSSIIISIGAGSKMPAKKWFHERYSEIANRLIEQKNAFLIFLGGKEEFNEIESLITNIHKKNRVLNLAGKTTVIESAEILKRSTLYFGNDTGTMHLAATVGTRCVTVFSSRGVIGRYEPYGNGHINIIKRIDCEGCYLEVCIEKNMECLRQIQVDEVWNKLKNALP